MSLGTGPSRSAPAPQGEADFDARLGEEFERRFPQFRSLFDPSEMAERLAGALSIRLPWSMESVVPGKALLTANGLRFRYSARLRDRTAGEENAVEVPVTALVFASDRAAQDYSRGVLAPLMKEVVGHPALEPFGVPAAALPGMRTSVHAFPIDPDLPGLPDASDPRRMRKVLQGYPALAGPALARLEDCAVAIAHYPRASRCVLRYSVAGTKGGNGGTWSAVAYGKTYADSGAERSLRVLQSLQSVAGNGNLPTLPMALGHVAALRLNLLGAVGGTPLIPALVKAHLARGEPIPDLERLVARAATVLGSLHGVPIAGLPERSLNEDIAELQSRLQESRAMSPTAAAYFGMELDRLSQAAAGDPGDDPCFCHGDFTPSQLLVDGEGVAIIDLDNVCLADPALDLGQFLAYLRVAVYKASRAGGVAASRIADALASAFLDGYLEAASPARRDRRRARAALHERASLIRMALHSWQQLKPARAALAVAVMNG
jgi:hypothetical protein